MREVDFKNETEYGIVKAYIDIMKEKPFDKIHVKEIVEESGVARSTFYIYFEDVLDLLEKLERMLLEQLVLYPSDSSTSKDFEGMPFESMEHWFAVGAQWRNTLRALLGDNGDPYFLRRLRNQLRENLNAMMDFDRAPNGRLRPYYVELLTASYIGMLTFMVSEDNDDDLINATELAEISNSTRTAFYRSDMTAPYISDSQLFGKDFEDR